MLLAFGKSKKSGITPGPNKVAQQLEKGRRGNPGNLIIKSQSAKSWKMQTSKLATMAKRGQVNKSATKPKPL